VDESGIQDDRWTSGGASEPSAELLHGAIAHVEQLIRRLDYAPDRLTVEEVEEPEPPRRIGKKSGAKALPEDPPGPAVAAAPAGAQAEALRITLTAHDEANRLLGEAAALRAAAAAEGQRILADAQRLAAELRVEAEADAERHRAEAIAAAAQMRSEAQQAMRAAIADATSAANEVHTAAQADAHRIRTEAEAWAAEQRETAEAMTNQALEQAERDADEIRDRAAEQGRSAAEQQVAAEVETAMAEATARIEAAESRAQATLSGATTQMRLVGERITALLGVAGATVDVLEQVAGELQALHTEAEAVPPPDGDAGGPAANGEPFTAEVDVTEADAETAETETETPPVVGDEPDLDAEVEPAAEVEPPAEAEPADPEVEHQDVQASSSNGGIAESSEARGESVGLDDLLDGERETASASAGGPGHGQRGKPGRPLGSLFRGEKRD
jgi:hypothetical protein